MRTTTKIKKTNWRPEILFRKIFIIALALWPHFSFALDRKIISSRTQVILKSRPEALLNQASRGVTELREVIFELQKSLSEITKPEEFMPYFDLLPQLYQLQVKLQLDEIYPQAVEKLGARMAIYGARWWDLGTSSPDLNAKYIKWMDEDGFSQFSGRLDLEIKKILQTNPIVLKNYSNGIEMIRVKIEKSYPNRLDLHSSYRLIQNQIAMHFIRQKDLNESQRLFWLSRISTYDVFGEILQSVHLQVFEIQIENAAELDLILSQVKAIDLRMSQLGVPPLWLTQLVAEINTELILKSYYFEKIFSHSDLGWMISKLRAKNLSSLSSQVMGADLAPKAAFSEYFRLTSEKILEALSQAKLSKESYVFSEYLKKQLLNIYSRKWNIEGTYQLRDKNSKKWTLSIAFVKEGVLYAALVDENEFVHKTYMNLSYDFKSNTFVGSERANDVENLRNLTMSFKVDGKGEIVFFDHAALPEFQLLKGLKTESYPDLLAESIGDHPNFISDVYSGEVELPARLSQRIIDASTKIKIKIRISVVGETLTIRSLSDNLFTADFSNGNRGLNGIVYATTPRLKTNWTQIRGQISKNSFEGYFIFGGFGITKKFSLKKIEDIK